MNRFLLIVNNAKPRSEEVSGRVTGFLSSYGHGVSCTAFYGTVSSEKELPGDTECVITIGGDGTLLQAARFFEGTDVRIIGINTGTLGYLTQYSPDEDLEDMLIKLIEDRYKTEPRMLLDFAVHRDGRCIYSNTALNEVLIQKYETLKVTRFCVYVNDVLLNECTGDGILAATPTGTTGLSLSAGGPIAEPSSRFIILTPVLAHALNSRSIVLSPDDIVKIVPGKDDEAVSGDGINMFRLQTGDEVLIRESGKKLLFAKVKESSFLDNLNPRLRKI